MDKKHTLGKIAIASLMMVSTAHAANHVNTDCFTDNTFLPTYGCASCHGHGGSANYEIADNTTYDQQATAAAPNKVMTEAQLLGALSPQGRSLYLNLDAKGKALALQLASQDVYKDKNLAIKEAVRRMQELNSSADNMYTRPGERTVERTVERSVERSGDVRR